MTTFLAIMTTLLLTVSVTFIGTLFLIHWVMANNEAFRNYWRETINEYSDYDKWGKL